jgi:nitroreductase
MQLLGRDVVRRPALFKKKNEKMMTLLEAIQARHSVRRYQHRALPPQVVEALQTEIDECNRLGQLHIQLVMNEPKAFSFLPTYGAFSGVEHYLVMAGPKAGDLDDRVGYYGERMVLLAQQLGLGTCWAGLTYRKVKGAFALQPGDKVACMISVGYPEGPVRQVPRKTVEQLSNAGAATPEWFRRAMQAVTVAPSAIHQQKYYFEYLGEKEGRPQVRARRLFSMIGYTQMDLGIAKLHFEIGAGETKFDWVE